jgi:nucleotide-binding universal stress UspA family protein
LREATAYSHMPPGNYEAGLEVETMLIGKENNQAERYLNRVCKRVKDKGFNSRVQIIPGSPAEAIVAYAKDTKVDLILMASHGSSGISRWAFGSVAEKVFRVACIPILMIRPPGCIPGF